MLLECPISPDWTIYIGWISKKHFTDSIGNTLVLQHWFWRYYKKKKLFYENIQQYMLERKKTTSIGINYYVLFTKEDERVYMEWNWICRSRKYLMIDKMARRGELSYRFCHINVLADQGFRFQWMIFKWSFERILQKTILSFFFAKAMQKDSTSFKYKNMFRRDQ